MVRSGAVLGRFWGGFVVCVPCFGAVLGRFCSVCALFYSMEFNDVIAWGGLYCMATVRAWYDSVIG